MLSYYLQGQLYAALRRTKLIPEDTGWQELGYSRCGRTDKGVSALGQVCASMRHLACTFTQSARDTSPSTVNPHRWLYTAGQSSHLRCHRLELHWTDW